MSELSRIERECLRQCALHHALIDLPLNSGGAMLHLESLGLIERIPEVRAPLEMLRSGYRLTQLGWSTLRQIENCR